MIPTVILQKQTIDIKYQKSNNNYNGDPRTYHFIMTNLCKGQEVTAGIEEGKANWLQVGKEVKRSRVLSS